MRWSSSTSWNEQEVPPHSRALGAGDAMGDGRRAGLGGVDEVHRLRSAGGDGGVAVSYRSEQTAGMSQTTPRPAPTLRKHPRALAHSLKNTPGM